METTPMVYPRFALVFLMSLLFSAPVWAAMQGRPCGRSDVGRTEKSDDEQNIIACLKSGESQIWKSMYSNQNAYGGFYIPANKVEYGCTLANPITGSCDCPRDWPRVNCSVLGSPELGGDAVHICGCYREAGPEVSVETTINCTYGDAYYADYGNQTIAPLNAACRAAGHAGSVGVATAMDEHTSETLFDPKAKCSYKLRCFDWK